MCRCSMPLMLCVVVTISVFKCPTVVSPLLYPIWAAPLMGSAPTLAPVFVTSSVGEGGGLRGLVSSKAGH